MLYSCWLTHFKYMKKKYWWKQEWKKDEGFVRLLYSRITHSCNYKIYYLMTSKMEQVSMSWEDQEFLKCGTWTVYLTQVLLLRNIKILNLLVLQYWYSAYLNEWWCSVLRWDGLCRCLLIAFYEFLLFIGIFLSYCTCKNFQISDQRFDPRVKRPSWLYFILTF